MRKSLSMALAAAFLVAGGPVAAAKHDARSEVLALERARLDATIKHDAAALRLMTTDDLTYVHASGIRQSKAQYIAYVQAGGVTFGSYGIDDEQVDIRGAVAITHGVFRFTTDATVQPPRSGKTLFTAVYVRTAGHWQLSAWEATKIS
jgi:ketosteroid isomerase-like protein